MIVSKVPTNKIALNNIKAGECFNVEKSNFYMKVSYAGTGFMLDADVCLCVHLETGALIRLATGIMVLPLVGSVQLR